MTKTVKPAKTAKPANSNRPAKLKTVAKPKTVKRVARKTPETVAHGSSGEMTAKVEITTLEMTGTPQQVADTLNGLWKGKSYHVDPHGVVIFGRDEAIEHRKCCSRPRR